jgi:peptidoglycan/LPS O-acetylase OafA/YrhL
MFYLFFPLACVLLFKMRRGMIAFAAVLLAFVAMGPFARTVCQGTRFGRVRITSLE